jgi:hypothetical protein
VQGAVWEQIACLAERPVAQILERHEIQNDRRTRRIFTNLFTGESMLSTNCTQKSPLRFDRGVLFIGAYHYSDYRTEGSFIRTLSHGPPGQAPTLRREGPDTRRTRTFTMNLRRSSPARNSPPEPTDPETLKSRAPLKRDPESLEPARRRLRDREIEAPLSGVPRK